MEREASPFFWCFFVLVLKREKMFSSCFFASLSLAHLYIRIAFLLSTWTRRVRQRKEKKKKEE